MILSFKSMLGLDHLAPYEDLNTQLSKLTQTGTVADYEAKFQRIFNKIPGLPESFLKGCYIEGV